MSWWDQYVVPFLRPETAGVTGAVLGFLNAPGASAPQKAFNLASGVAVAVFGVPYLLELVGIRSAAGSLAIAFLAGTVGMNLLAKFIAWANTLSLQDVIAMVTRQAPKEPRE